MEGNRDKAIADLNEAIRLDPKFDRAYCWRGIAYEKNGELDKAIADYTEAIRLDPNIPLRITAVAMPAGKRAITTRLSLITTMPSDWTRKIHNAYLDRGNTYLTMGDNDKAIADYCDAIRLNRKYAVAYYNRGIAYERKGDKAKAEEDFAQAKKLGYKSR